MENKKKLTILCIDDEQYILDSLTDLLMDDFIVKTTTSGKEAIDILGKEKIAVVITDQRMPDTEGTDILEEISKKKYHCKRILLTGYSDIDAAIKAVNFGNLDRYILKPWDNDELLLIIKQLCDEYTMEEFFNDFKDLMENHQKKE